MGRSSAGNTGLGRVRMARRRVGLAVAGLVLIASSLASATTIAPVRADAEPDSPAGFDGYSDVEAGPYHNCGLTTAGAADCWGRNWHLQSTDHIGPYTQLVAGYLHSCGLTPAGAADCWGGNADGQATDQPGPYTDLGAGYSHTCGLTAAGAADCWGDNDSGQATDQPGPYTDLAVGYHHTCGLTPAGAAVCWGWNEDGQATDQPGPYTQLTAGFGHSCGLTAAGSADCWGDNDNGQATDQPGPYTDLAVGGFHSCGLTPAGAVDCWGDDEHRQSRDKAGPYTDVAAGGSHTCALTPEGTATCWGLNDDGQADDQPRPGWLRAITEPALPAVITVDGVPRDSWGLTWMEFPAGNHEVCFAPVPGYTSPPCQDVEVAAGVTTHVQGSYVQRGTLRVLTSPAVPSTITVDGNPANDWGVWTDLDPGTYEVCFGAVADYAAPACQQAVVTGGVTTEITGTFDPDPGAPGSTGHGYLRATTAPAMASRITVDGSVADSWGLTWLKLAPGTHEVCFEGVLHATAPGCQDVEIAAGATTEVQGDFVPHGFLRVLTDPPLPASVFLDGYPINAWGFWTSRPPGTYQVCFGEWDGFDPPACEDVEVTAGTTTTLTGTYS